MRKLFLIALIAGVAWAGGACAQTMEDRLRDQLRSTMTQLQQLQDDQASLQAAKAAAEKERDALKAELASAKAQLAKAQKQSDKSPEMEAEVAKYRDAYTQATSSAQQTQADRDKLQTSLTGAQTMLAACQAKNDKLLVLGKSKFSRLPIRSSDSTRRCFANEPLHRRMKRVELENIAQDYGDGGFTTARFDPRTGADASAYQRGCDARASHSTACEHIPMSETATRRRQIRFHACRRCCCAA